VLEFRARLDVFALLRAGALIEGTISNWRFGNYCLTFHASVPGSSFRQRAESAVRPDRGKEWISAQASCDIGTLSALSELE
jgi:hypothetical protein